MNVFVLFGNLRWKCNCLCPSFVHHDWWGVFSQRPEKLLPKDPKKHSLRNGAVRLIFVGRRLLEYLFYFRDFIE